MSTNPPPPPGFVPESSLGVSTPMPGFSTSTPEPPPGFVPESSLKPEVTSKWERFKTGLADPIYGAAQIADRVLVNPIRQAISPGAASMEDVIRQRDAEYVAPEGVDWMRAGGNAANPVNWLGGGGATSVGRLALGGAATGVLNPVEADQDLGDFALTKAKQAAAGGAGGAAAGVLTKALGRIAKPIGDKAADTEALEAMGVMPTFGQAMAQKGHALGKAVNTAEEAAGSIPFASGPLRRSRERALEQWRAAARNAAAPEGTTMPTGTVDEVREAISAAYDGILDPVRLPYQSVTYQPDMRRLTQGLALSPEGRRMVQETFEGLRMNGLQNPTPGAQPTAAAAQRVESELKTLAARFSNSQDPSQREIGEAFQRIAREYGDTWRSALPGNLRNEIAAIDRRYPDYVALRQAAKTVGAKQSEGDPNAIMPSGLWRASRAADRSFQKRQHIAGDAPQQELARLGMAVENKLPDSGTATRAIVGGVLAGGSPLFGLTPAAAASALALAGYGTRQVQDYLMGRAAPEAQQRIMEVLRAAAVPASREAGSAAAQLGE